MRHYYRYIPQTEPSEQVREERGEIAVRQDGDTYSCQSLGWTRRAQKLNSRAAPNTKYESVHLLVGWTTCEGLLTPACLRLVKGITQNHRMVGAGRRLKVIQSNHPAKVGSPRTDCTRSHPGRFWISLGKETPQHV